MPGPFHVPPGGGDARWVTGSLDTIKATGEQTGGSFGLIESTERRGDAPPLHVHEHEDEACYVIEGDLTFFLGDEHADRVGRSFRLRASRDPSHVSGRL
jgi:quercetin dioxygenase-like cupin family protein